MIQGTIINDNNSVNTNGYTENGYTETENEESVGNFAQQFKQMFDAFADAMPNGSHQQKNSKGFFKKFSEYVGSKQFEDDVNEKAEKYHIPPKQIAKNFFLKVLGIIGDILGIVVNTACSIVDTAVSLLSALLHSAVEVVGKVANTLVRAVSLNQTVVYC